MTTIMDSADDSLIFLEAALTTKLSSPGFKRV